MTYRATAQIITGHQGPERISKVIEADSETEALAIASRQVADSHYFVVSVEIAS